MVLTRTLNGFDDVCRCQSYCRLGVTGIQWLFASVWPDRYGGAAAAGDSLVSAINVRRQLPPAPLAHRDRGSDLQLFVQAPAKPTP